MEVFTLPALQDNYNFVIHDRATGRVAAVDPSGLDPVDSFLKSRNWKLHTILNTHQHPDHVGGNLPLKEKHSCQIVASHRDRHRVPGFDRGLEEGQKVQVGQLEAQVLFVPGHTHGHIAYHFTKYNKLFCGDTLFSLGCGRLFEGSAEELLTSLKKIGRLPPETTVYCAHEYTLQNGRFALSVDPHNKALQAYYKGAEDKIAKNEFTIPFQLSEQLQCNPFLRTHRKEIAQQLLLPDSASELETFTLLRKRKDTF